jgi:hypothetical protein
VIVANIERAVFVAVEPLGATVVVTTFFFFTVVVVFRASTEALVADEDEDTHPTATAIAKAGKISADRFIRDPL